MKAQLVLYNTASRKKEKFHKDDKKVGLYCCGPTVYNYAHVGNLRTYLFEDILKRVLLSAGYDVNHIVNITDVGHLTSDADSGDDKMEKGAIREGKTVWEIAENYTQKFMEDIKALNILDPNMWPKATDHIPEMISMIQELEEKGFTYRTDDGIYFDTEKFPQYADFAKLDTENLQGGSRIDMGDKKHVTDFSLWKFSPTGKKRAMEWDSPWGVGFPGWHIECSAMSLKYLPQPVDIHCGGCDHIRIHHTNEIAQVEASTGKPFVSHWMHGEFLVAEKGKMSKSDGKDGFVTIDSLRARNVDPLAYRFFCFGAHYRSPLKYTVDGLESAYSNLKKMRNRTIVETKGATESVNDSRVDEILADFWCFLYDDMNMPRALAEVWNVLKNSELSSSEKKAALEKMDTILALDLFRQDEEDGTVQSDEGGVVVKIVSVESISDEKAAEIKALVRERKQAREEKNWGRADEIRDALNSMSITVKDMADGSIECHLS